MDLSPLIFVALAVAWAVYLVPQALRHHDEVVRSRSVERFSHTMRVLARREPVNRSSSRLVVTPGRVPSAPVVTTKASTAPTVDAPAAAHEAPRPVPAPVRREAARRAARRRRRVLSVLLLLLVLTGGLVAARLLAWPVLVLPAVLLVAWLVACRLMVRRERGISGPLARIPATVLPEAAPVFVAGQAGAAGPVGEETQEVAVVSAPLAEEAVSGVLPSVAAAPSEDAPLDVPTPRAPAAAGLWEPVPVTLPTYVSKPAAERRSVRTIDLDATGVWTSGRSDADSALVRDAEERARRDEGEAPGRAVGS